MTWIKICGISDIESAITAGQAGCDYLGMVFAPSKRQVSPDKAGEISAAVHRMKSPPKVVGVFVNETAAEINRIVEYCHLDWIQLSGNEDWEYCKQLTKPVIKVFHIEPEVRHAEISAQVWKVYNHIHPHQCICLLDSTVKGSYGGTGITFNWEIAKEICEKFSVMVAGGLTPDNVRELIEKTSPWAVDVSSGVETNGKKDPAKIKSFIETVRQADLELKGGTERD